jgi:hypothetical protein
MGAEPVNVWSSLLMMLLTGTWFIGMVFLPLKAAMNFTDRKGAVLWLVAGILWTLTGPILAVAVSKDTHQHYRDRCRSAGGIPINSHASINCVTPEGRYLDVE